MLDERSSEKFDTLKKSQEYKYNKLVDCGELLKQKREAFEACQQTGIRVDTRTWVHSEKNGRQRKPVGDSWQVELLKEGAFEQLRSTFDHATETNTAALDLILSELDAMLALQERAGTIEQKLDTLNDEIDSLISEERRNTLFNDTPPMFTGQYLAQLKKLNFWEEAFTGLHEISLPRQERCC